MEAKHTPGEWDCACDSYGKVQHSRKYDCVYTVVKGLSGGDRIVTVAARIENSADAHLIAAAPELLTELIGVLRIYDRDNTAANQFDRPMGKGARVLMTHKHAAAIRELIAKAQGKAVAP